MKAFLSRTIVRQALLYTLLAGVTWAAIALSAEGRGAVVGYVVGHTFGQMAGIMVAIFLLIGLLQVWVPPRRIAQLLGHEAGWKAFAIAAVVPLVVGGSLFTILPLLHTLRHHGARIAVIGTFITAWGGKLPLLPLEVRFVGWPFAALRLAGVIVMAVCIGLLLEIVVGERHVPGAADVEEKGGSA